MSAQTPKNPVDTRPEGTAPSCSYSESIGDGKASSSSNCTPGQTPGTDPNLRLPPSAAERFPFPGTAPEVPLTPVPATQNPAQPGVPANPDTSAGSPSAARRFPFPGETAPSAPAMPGRSNDPQAPGSDSPSPLQDAGSSGSSSSSSSSQAEPGSSSSSSSSNGANLPDDDPDTPLPTPKHNARKKLPVSKPVTPDEQEARDVQVAGFYQNDGNFAAAYQRAKEAVSLMDDDPEAHLALAEAARKLGKLDEAGTHYKKVLALDPVPKLRKVAEKALKEMSGE